MSGYRVLQIKLILNRAVHSVCYRRLKKTRSDFSMIFFNFSTDIFIRITVGFAKAFIINRRSSRKFAIFLYSENLIWKNNKKEYYEAGKRL
jgi:hypothetical protein